MAVVCAALLPTLMPAGCMAVFVCVYRLRAAACPQEFKAYRKLRVERMNERVVGLRAKKAKEAEKDAPEAAK